MADTTPRLPREASGSKLLTRATPPASEPTSTAPSAAAPLPVVPLLDRKLSRLSSAIDVELQAGERSAREEKTTEERKSKARKSHSSGHRPTEPRDGEGSARLAPPSRKAALPAEEVTVFVHDASLFGVAERGLWHYANIGAAIPRKLWKEKDGLSILSCTTKTATAVANGFTVPEETLEEGSGGPVTTGDDAPGFTPPPSAMKRPLVSVDELPAHMVMRMAPNTATKYVYSKYRYVIAMDVSPSMFAMDVHSLQLPFHEAFQTLMLFLKSLVVPMPSSPQHVLVERLGQKGPTFNASTVFFIPEIHLSVIAQASHDNASCKGVVGCRYPPTRVLVHGFSLNSDTFDQLITILAAGWKAVEAEWFESSASGATDSIFSPGQGQAGAPPSDAGGPSLGPLLESAVNTLKLLPGTACPSVILLTDCAAGLPASAAYGSLVMQMLRHDIACVVLQLGTCSGVHSSLGYIPDTESMAFLTMATGGFRLRHRDLLAASEPSAYSSALMRNFYARAAASTRAPISAISTTAKAPSFSTALWSPLQQQAFIRTSVLSVSSRNLNDEGITAALSRATVPAALKIQQNRTATISVRPHPLPTRTTSTSSHTAAPEALTSAPGGSGEGEVDQELPSYGRNTGRPGMLDVSGDGRNVSQVRAKLTADSFGTALANAVVGAKQYQRDGQTNFRHVSNADYAFPWSGPPPAVQYHRALLYQYHVHVDPRLLLECRLKEGFRVLMGTTGIARPAGSSTSSASQMQLVLSWQPHIIIIYSMQGTPASKRQKTIHTKDEAHTGPKRLPSVASIASHGTDPHAQPSASQAQGRVKGRRRLSDASQSTMAAKRKQPQVHVTIEVTGRQDFVRLFLEALTSFTAKEGSAAAAKADTGVRMFNRLSASAVEPERAKALYHFLTVLQQVDKVLVHLCNPPRGDTAMVASTPHVATATTSTDRAPAPMTILDRRKQLTQSALSEEQPVAPEALSIHAASQPHSTYLQERISSSSSADTGVALMYAPIASLSLAAWHRWFDVERFEVMLLLPAAALSLLCQEPIISVSSAHTSRTDTAGDISPSCPYPAADDLESALLHHVCARIAGWADSALPATSTIFAFQGEPTPADSTAANPATRALSTSYIKFVNRAPAQPRSAAPTVTVDGADATETPTPAMSAISAPVKSTIMPQTSTTVHSRAQSSFHPMSSNNSAAHPKALSALPSRRGPMDAPDAPLTQPFIFIRVAPHSEVQPLDNGKALGSALCIVHLAFFACPPPVRAAQIKELSNVVQSTLCCCAPALNIHREVSVPIDAEDLLPLGSAKDDEDIGGMTARTETESVDIAGSVADAAGRRESQAPTTRPSSVDSFPDNRSDGKSTSREVLVPYTTDVFPATPSSTLRAVSNPIASPARINVSAASRRYGRSAAARRTPAAQGAPTAGVPVVAATTPPKRSPTPTTPTPSVQATPVPADEKQSDALQSSPNPIDNNTLTEASATNTGAGSTSAIVKHLTFPRDPTPIDAPVSYVAAPPLHLCGSVQLPSSSIARILVPSHGKAALTESGGGFLHEMQHDVSAASSCCGGSAIPKKILSSMLWHRRWTYKVVWTTVDGSMDAWDVAARVSAAVVVGKMATPMGNQSHELGRDGPKVDIDASRLGNWSLIDWERTTPSPESSSGVHLLSRSTVARVFHVAVTPPANTCAVLVTDGQYVPPQWMLGSRPGPTSGFLLSTSVAQQRIHTEILEPKVRALTPDSFVQEVGFAVHVDFFLEPQEGHVQLRQAPAKGCVEEIEPAISSTRGLYTALCSTTYARDITSILASLKRSNLPASCMVHVHATDAMNHVSQAAKDAFQLPPAAPATSLPPVLLPAVIDIPGALALRFRPTVKHDHHHREKVGLVTKIAVASAAMHLASAGGAPRASPPNTGV